MAQVIPLKQVTKPEPISKGKLSLLTFIHEQLDARKGKKYPQIVNISEQAVSFKINSDWNFDLPIEALTINY